MAPTTGYGMAQEREKKKEPPIVPAIRRQNRPVTGKRTFMSQERRISRRRRTPLAGSRKYRILWPMRHGHSLQRFRHITEPSGTGVAGRLFCFPFRSPGVRLRTPAFSLSSPSRDLLLPKTVDTMMTVSGATSHAADHSWTTYLMRLARSRDSSLDAYDMQCARACVAGAHGVGILLFWRSPGKAPISSGTMEAIDKRMPLFPSC